MTVNSNFEPIEQTIKYFIEEILENQPVEEIIEKTGIIDLAIEKAESENKNIMNMIVRNQTSKINPKANHDFFQRKIIANKQLGEAIIKKIIEVIPAKYAESLSFDLGETANSISHVLKNHSQPHLGLIKNQLNQILQNLENPFVEIAIDDLEIQIQNGNKELICSFNFTIKKNAKQPVVIISVSPQLGSNPLMKIKFKIQGEVNISDMIFGISEGLRISFGEFDVNLNIIIEEIQILKTPIMTEETEKILYTLSMRDIKEKISEISIKEN